MTTSLATPTADTFGTPPRTAEAYDRVRMLQLVEDALRDSPYCACGAMMTIDVDGATMWLECPTFMEPSVGRLAWLRGGIRTALHEKQVVARDLGMAA